MKKIGIVTYINLNNYGSVLQATALADFLDSNGYDCKIINIDSKVLTKRLEPSLFNKNFLIFVKNILVRIKHPIYFIRWSKRKMIFSLYRKGIPYLTKEKYNRSSLPLLEQQFDCFISGGDQVWNLYNTDGDTRFMLDFVNDSKKMKSYSASIGRTFINEEYESVAVANIRRFSSVLVREEQTAKLLFEKYNIFARHVLDSVFLLKHDRWEKYADPSYKKTNYVLFYSIANCVQYLNAAKRYANSHERKLLVINSGFVNFPVDGFLLKTPAPNTFLSMFRNASCAIVASFHGVAFCIIYHIDFVCFNFIGTKDVRILNLLNICGLQDRLITNPDSFVDIDPISWESVDKKLDEKRKIDISIFLESLNNV